MILRWTTIILITLLPFIIDGKKKKCPKNMVYKKCTNTCPKFCDPSLTPKKGCKLNCKKPGCECKSGYRMTLKGKCVKKKDCPCKKTTTSKRPSTPKCKKNEIYTGCKSACEPKCSDRKDKPKKCTLQCIVGECECKKGYVRNELDGRCIRPKKCPKPPTKPKCSRNETYTDCKSACEPKCSDPKGEPKVCTLQCIVNACECKKKYVRDERSGKCILRKDCPRVTTPRPPSTPQCKKNEIYTGCKSACEPKCSDPLGEPKVCTLQCIVGECQCKEGYVRNEKTDECVRRHECPNFSTPIPRPTPVCPPNSTFTTCLSPCPKKCSDKPGEPKICVKRCDGIGCQCKRGYVLNEIDNKCIRRSDCPCSSTPKCPRNMVYTECKSACEPKCSDDPNKPKICTLQCAGKGCECREPFALDEWGRCIPREDCNKHTGGTYIIHIIRKTVVTICSYIFRR